MEEENEIFRLAEGEILRYCLEDFGLEVSASPVMLNAVVRHFMDEMGKCGYIERNEEVNE